MKRMKKNKRIKKKDEKLNDEAKSNFVIFSTSTSQLHDRETLLRILRTIV